MRRESTFETNKCIVRVTFHRSQNRMKWNQQLSATLEINTYHTPHSSNSYWWSSSTCVRPWELGLGCSSSPGRAVLYSPSVPCPIGANISLPGDLHSSSSATGRYPPRSPISPLVTLRSPSTHILDLNDVSPLIKVRPSTDLVQPNRENDLIEILLPKYTAPRTNKSLPSRQLLWIESTPAAAKFNIKDSAPTAKKPEAVVSTLPKRAKDTKNKLLANAVVPWTVNSLETEIPQRTEAESSNHGSEISWITRWRTTTESGEWMPRQTVADRNLSPELDGRNSLHVAQTRAHWT